MTFSSPDSGLTADVMAHADWANGAWTVKATTPLGEFDFQLGVAGRHNVKNALAATACAIAAGVPLASIACGLAAFAPVTGRSRAISITHVGHLLMLIDDSYNSNPDSMRAAIDVLAELPGPRLLVMGDMGEVGDQGPEFHDEAGRHARLSGIENMFALGKQTARSVAAFGTGKHFSGMDDLIRAVLAQLPHVQSVLVKGSRFMGMEQVVQAIATSSEQQQEAR